MIQSKEPLKASELRIGNYISGPSNSYGKITAIDNIRKDEGILSVVKFDYGPYYHIEAIHPIPITPEILEKAGFEKNYSNSNEGIFMYNKIIGGYDYRATIDNSSNRIILHIYHYATTDAIAVECSTIHKLQNLIFLTSNQELTITL